MPLRRRALAQRVAELEKALQGQAASATRGATVIDSTGAMAAITPPLATSPPPTGVAGGYQALPRTPAMFGGALGPGYPITPAAIDQLRTDGRTDPRITQYDPARNLNLHDRPVPFAVLRRMADQCDLVRRCIEIRKSDITGLKWSFTLSDTTVSQIMQDEGETNRAVAAKKGRDKYLNQINQLTEFWQTPDRLNGYEWADWVGGFLEEHFVLDAVAVYPHPTLGGDLHSLEILDGATIKPLLDHRGARPSPPAPAYQQILWGFPRGEFQASAEPDDEYAADQLAYIVRNRRTFTPYGMSVVEQSLPAAALWLERQQWLRSEYTDGVTATAYLTMKEGQGEEWTPDQRRMWEESINDTVAGNTARRHRLRLLIPGMDVVETGQIDEKYKQEYDEFLIKRVGSNFGVQPTQLGVIPRTGIGGRGQQQGEQEEAETTSQKPLMEWLTDQVNSLSRAYLGAPSAITLRFDGGDSDEDELQQANTAHVLVSFGGKTLNDFRNDQGLTPFPIPEADEPMVITPTGPVFLTGTLDKQLNPPPPPPSPFGHPGGQEPPPATEGDEPKPPASQQAEADASKKQAQQAQTDEAKKFLTFVANRQGKPWRDFTFEHIPAVTAAELNALGRAGGDSVLVKTLVADLGKAAARPDRPGHQLEAKVAAAYHDRITAALRSLIDPRALADEFLRTHTQGKKADPSPSSEWLNGQDIDTAALTAVVTGLRTDSYWLGQHTAARQLRDAGYEGIDDPTADLDWGKFQPGDPAAAGLLDATGGLEQLLADVGITVQGVTSTTLAEISTQLGYALVGGWSGSQLADAIDGILSDPSRAEMIADTELCRAVSTATLATYLVNGVGQSEWLDTGGACPICQANAAAGPVTTGQAFPSGDPSPPAHPRCRCALTPVPESVR